ncbi:hypothetical protein SmJEL517_g05415 [Synchytrium microbalum]|uniref:F-box domain-containing protein n=1 Tax=Synchytrium microbalum TaxID=1806994 RepID=A0A507BW91_9FUNG|nr:uncharacterized protein SmJEL517_g05415 [Synchytrium microbalum]TPX31169.1 hypothetical protein SmJEL517_g05415 [Synchytrium microbalum]
MLQVSKKRKRPRAPSPADEPVTAIVTALADFTTLFSDEIVLTIFQYLKDSQLCNLASVSQTWNRLALDRQLWKRLFLNHFFLKPPSSPLTARELEAEPGNASMLMNQAKNWHSMYRLQHKWANGTCKVSTIPTATDMHHATHIGYVNDTLISCAGRTVQISHIPSQKVFSRFDLEETRRPEAYITCVNVTYVVDEVPTIVVGLSDGCILTYRMSDSHAVDFISAFIPSHPKPAISTLTLCDDVIVSVSADFCLGIYQMLQTSTKAVLRLLHSLKSFVSWAPTDIYTVRKGERETPWASVPQYVTYISYSVPLYGEGGWEVGLQELIFDIWAIVSSRSFRPSDSVNRHDSVLERCGDPVTCIRFKYPYLVTGHSDNTVRVYTLSSIPRMHHSPLLILTHSTTLFSHSSTVRAVDFDVPTGRMITAGRDGIKLWNLPTEGVNDPILDGPSFPVKCITTIREIGAVDVSRGVVDVKFDEGRIVTLAQNSVRVLSFFDS